MRRSLSRVGPGIGSSEWVSPLSDDDRDILAGISVMMLAIANRQNLADQAEEMRDEDEPRACGALREDGQCCVREEGHSGRHKYRPLNGLVNWAAATTAHLSSLRIAVTRGRPRACLWHGGDDADG